MKKLLLFLAALLIVAIPVHAQKDGGTGFQWGLKLGPNFSTWAGDDAEPSSGEDKKMSVGLHGGVFAMIAIADMFYFQPEVLYSSEGVKYEDNSNDAKFKISTSHLNIPLMLRVQTSGGFYLVFGPQVGFTLGGKEKFEYQGQEQEDDLTDLRGLLMSGLIGAGFKSKSGWGVYTRYGRAFSTLFDVESGDDPKIYNSTISLSLFYMLAATKGKGSSR